MKNKNIKVIILYTIGILLFGWISMYAFIYFFPNLFNTTITTIKKDVTVTDSGIADGVEKVYDAVVVVSVYKDGAYTAAGTGFVYKTDGNVAYILTNNHVISSFDNVAVTFTNGETHETKIVGSDVLSDIAVLSLSKKDIISVAEIGNSSDLRVGDTSFAVGAPLKDTYSWTVTRGIISGKDRMVEVQLSSESGDYVMNVIQTDTAINNGNSGGPLCNANGEVIGITSLKLVSEAVEGMGFAIPIETALEYANKFISGEVITHPYLGVSMLSLQNAQYYQDFYNLASSQNISYGVVIASVEENSPADKAGIKAGDIIIKIDDKKVTSVGYFKYYLYTHNVGDKVSLTYVRNSKEYTTTAKVISK